MLEFKTKIDSLPQDDSAHESQKMYMYHLIRKMKPSRIVEVGTHKGITTLYLAQALYDNGYGHVWTYDPYDYGVPERLKQFPELNQHITFHQKKGIECEENDIDFVFIDGFHEKEHVLAEIKHFLPRLSEGAVMLFHDAGGDNEFVGVNAAIAEAGLETEAIVLDGTMKKYTHVWK